MKIKLLKDHLEYKKGDEIDVDAERANYFIRCGVAKQVKEKATHNDTPKNKEGGTKPKA